MPIRINLLAEAQAAEQLRRHDPVKRVIYVAAFLVALMLVWSSSLQLEAMLARKAVTDRQTEIQTRTNEFERVLSDQKNMAATKGRLDALKKMTNSRFLQGNLMNAMQQISVDGVRLTQLKVDQNFFLAAGTKTQTNGTRIIPGRPDSVTERIVVTLNARDSSINPGDQVNKFKEAVADEAYFKNMLNKTNAVQLVYLSAPQTTLEGKSYVIFTLECHFPEYSR